MTGFGDRSNKVVPPEYRFYVRLRKATLVLHGWRACSLRCAESACTCVHEELVAVIRGAVAAARVG